ARGHVAPNLVTKSVTISAVTIIMNAITGPSSMRAATSTLDAQFRMLLIAPSRVRSFFKLRCTPACWRFGAPPLKTGTRLIRIGSDVSECARHRQIWAFSQPRGGARTGLLGRASGSKLRADGDCGLLE